MEIIIFPFTLDEWLAMRTGNIDNSDSRVARIFPWIWIQVLTYNWNIPGFDIEAVSSLLLG